MSVNRRANVLAGIGHCLIVVESLKSNRKHLIKMARTLEQYKTSNVEAKLIARKAAEGMRKISDSLTVAEAANTDACRCFGFIVKEDLSARNERTSERTGASDGANAAPDSGPPTPAMTCVPTTNVQ